MAAPMITKQIKAQNMTDTQFRVIQQRLENTMSIPSGAIMFFEERCPNNWTDLSADYAGRYIRIDGRYDICDKQGEDENGECVRVKSTNTLQAGDIQGEANRRILGTFPGTDADLSISGDDYVDSYKTMGLLSGAFDYVTSEQVNRNEPFVFSADRATHKWYSSWARTFNTSNNYATFIDRDLLTVVNNNSAPRWFINSIDTNRVLPTDLAADETRPKTVVLKACRAPGN